MPEIVPEVEQDKRSLSELFSDRDLRKRIEKRARHMLYLHPDRHKKHPLFLIPDTVNESHDKPISNRHFFEQAEKRLQQFIDDPDQAQQDTNKRIEHAIIQVQTSIPKVLEAYNQLPIVEIPTAVSFSSLEDHRRVLDKPRYSQLLYLFRYIAENTSVDESDENREERKALFAVAIGFVQSSIAVDLNLNNPPDTHHSQLTKDQMKKRRQKHVLWDKITLYAFGEMEKGSKHSDVVTSIKMEKELQYQDENRLVVS